VEIVNSIQELAETEGIFTETAGGVTAGVAAKLYAHRRIKCGELTVMCITGNGLKTTDALAGQYQTPVPVRARLSDFEEYLRRQHVIPAREHELALIA
jgi:threonine synthase